MRKFLGICALILVISLLFTVMGKANNLDYTDYKPEAVPTQAKEVTTLQPPVNDVDLIDFMASVGFQAVVRVKRLKRTINWFKFEDGTKLSQDKLTQMNDDEKKWYAQGYLVEYSEYSEPEDWLISGSGVIIYSRKYETPVLMKNGQGKMEFVHGETLGITNWHVVEQLVDYESRGNSRNPQNVYEERDIIRSTLPPSIKIREGARPIEQQYFKVETQNVYIRHSENQLYEVRAEIVAVDNSIDIAVLRIKNVFNLPYAIWRGTPPRVGETVWIYGAPLGLRFSVDKGQVNQVGLNLGKGYGIVWDDQIKMDIAAAPGSSGSGIFDVYGNLIAQEHGVLVYNGNYISGGHLATNGMSIREWLIWSGFAHTVLQPRYRL